MTNLARLRPEPIPAIYPLPEHLAEGRRKAWYEEMKQALQVPWMGVVTMAYAHYPTFYATLWQGVRELCASRPFVELCLDNRAFVETEIAKLAVRRLQPLHRHRSNPVMRGSYATCHGRERMTDLARLRPEPIPAIYPLPEHLAEGRRKAWYEEMKQALQVPWMGVVTMAYAHYPTFYATLWQGVRELCASRPFVELCLDNRALRRPSARCSGNG